MSRSSQFYLVLDVTNMTNHEMELHYTQSKCIYMEGKEPCRIPVPVDRCPLNKLSVVLFLIFTYLLPVYLLFILLIFCF